MTDRNDVHARLSDLSGLYVLGALALAERAEFEEHLRTCAICRDEVASLETVTDGLLASVPLAAPPPALRARVLREAVMADMAQGDAPATRVGPGLQPRPEQAPTATVLRPDWREDRPGRPDVAVAPTRRSGMSWLTAAAAVLALVASGYAWTLRAQVADLAARLNRAIAMAEDRDRELAVVRTVAQQAQSTVSVLSAADLRRVELEGQRPLAPSAHGRAFWSRSRGGLVFTATNLPPAPDGKVYQLWFVTTVAVSAGLLEPDASGQVSMVAPTDRSMGEPVAMAVTLEPAGGVPAPTGEKYLIGVPSAGI